MKPKNIEDYELVNIPFKKDLCNYISGCLNCDCMEFSFDDRICAASIEMRKQCQEGLVWKEKDILEVI